MLYIIFCISLLSLLGISIAALIANSDSYNKINEASDGNDSGYSDIIYLFILISDISPNPAGGAANHQSKYSATEREERLNQFLKYKAKSFIQYSVLLLYIVLLVILAIIGIIIYMYYKNIYNYIFISFLFLLTFFIIILNNFILNLVFDYQSILIGLGVNSAHDSVDYIYALIIATILFLSIGIGIVVQHISMNKKEETKLFKLEKKLKSTRSKS